MPVLDRFVRHLRFTASHEDHARHGRVQLEDALRTASFGDEARLIVVRHLDLGRVSARAPATSWSRRIEETFRRTSTAPVSIHDRTAPNAEAVYFNSHDEPWLLLALRTLTRQPCIEWYWRSALPDWKPGLSSADTFRLCIRTLAARGGLPLTLQLLTRMPSGVSPEPLFQSLETADLAAIRDALGFPLTLAETRPLAAPPSTSSPLTSPPPLTEVDRRFVATWGPTDIRTHWLAAARLIAVSTRRFSLSSAGIVTAFQIQQLVQHWHRESASNHPFLLLSRPAPSAPASPEPPLNRAETVNSSPLLPPQTLPAPEPRPLTPPDFAPERVFTRAGGLFFLLPLLNRSGLPLFLETLPPAERADLPWQILKLALRHARIDADDPLVLALNDLPVCAEPLGHWLLAIHRHARRLTSLTLRQLIQRPALVTLTATHIDVFFRPGDADLRLRRAALDLDPGWVPWLGRAISYHFTRDD